MRRQNNDRGKVNDGRRKEGIAEWVDWLDGKRKVCTNDLNPEAVAALIELGDDVSAAELIADYGQRGRDYEETVVEAAKWLPLWVIAELRSYVGKKEHFHRDGYRFVAHVIAKAMCTQHLVTRNKIEGPPIDEGW